MKAKQTPKEGKKYAIKIPVTKTERELIRRSFPRGAVVKMFFAMIAGSALPPMKNEERRAVDQIKLHLAYISQQLTRVVELLDFVARSGELRPDVVEQFIKIYALLETLAQSLNAQPTKKRMEESV